MEEAAALAYGQCNAPSLCCLALPSRTFFENNYYACCSIFVVGLWVKPYCFVFAMDLIFWKFLGVATHH